MRTGTTDNDSGTWQEALVTSEEPLSYGWYFPFFLPWLNAIRLHRSTRRRFTLTQVSAPRSRRTVLNQIDALSGFFYDATQSLELNEVFATAALSKNWKLPEVMYTAARSEASQ